MIKGKTVLATICARGGSKGVKDKNIITLGDKPVLIRTLELVKKSKYIDRYIISTDSDAIIRCARKWGYEVQFKRPARLAGPKISRIDAIRHAVDYSAKQDGKPDIVIDLGVAAPLKNAKDLDGVLEALVRKKSGNVFSVMEAGSNPYFNMVEKSRVKKGKPSKVSLVKKIPGGLTGRQGAPPVYEMNDAFNAWFTPVLYTKSPQFNANTDIYCMPAERSVDIDSPLDLAFARFLVETKRK